MYDACRTALQDQGILITQTTETPAHWSGAQDQSAGSYEPNGVKVTTTLLHVKSGEWLAASLHVRPQRDDAQGLGSAITYLRRYTLLTVAGVVTDDDDGNEATRREPPRQAPAPRREVVKGPMPKSIDQRGKDAWAAVVALEGETLAKDLCAAIAKQTLDPELRVSELETYVRDHSPKKAE